MLDWPNLTSLDEPNMDWAELPPDRLMEACSLPRSGPAWSEFMRRYHPVITAAAIRVSHRWGAGTTQEIDDVVQEVYLKLCSDNARVLLEFGSVEPAAIFGYLKTISTNVAHDFFRRRSSKKRGQAQTASLAEIAERPASCDIERRLTLSDVDRLLVATTQGEAGDRDRAIFWFYYRFGMTARAIAALPGVSLNPKGVEAVLLRLTKAIRKRMFEKQEMDAD